MHVQACFSSAFEYSVVNSCSLEETWLLSLAEQWIYTCVISNDVMLRLQSTKGKDRDLQTLMIVCDS